MTGGCPAIFQAPTQFGAVIGRVTEKFLAGFASSNQAFRNRAIAPPACLACLAPMHPIERGRSRSRSEAATANASPRSSSGSWPNRGQGCLASRHLSVDCELSHVQALNGLLSTVVGIRHHACVRRFRWFFASSSVSNFCIISRSTSLIEVSSKLRNRFIFSSLTDLVWSMVDLPDHSQPRREVAGGLRRTKNQEAGGPICAAQALGYSQFRGWVCTTLLARGLFLPSGGLSNRRVMKKAVGNWGPPRRPPRTNRWI
jgi:hypothetical protein